MNRPVFPSLNLACRPLQEPAPGPGGKTWALLVGHFRPAHTAFHVDRSSLSPHQASCHASSGSGPHPWVTLGRLSAGTCGGHDWGAPGIPWAGSRDAVRLPQPRPHWHCARDGLVSLVLGGSTRTRAVDRKRVPRPAASAPIGGWVAMQILRPCPQPECGSQPAPGETAQNVCAAEMETLF